MRINGKLLGNNNNNNNFCFAPGTSFPGDPQIRANKPHSFRPQPAIQNPQFLETASKGDGVVTLKCYRNPLKEEAACFAGVTRYWR